MVDAADPRFPLAIYIANYTPKRKNQQAILLKSQIFCQTPAIISLYAAYVYEI